MKKYVLTAARFTLVLIVLCAVIYPLFIASVAKFAPNGGKGETVSIDGRIVGYANIGQKFTEDKYFWGRPSAVDYNAAGSAGSNKAPSNPDYLKQVEGRIDSFLAHNPSVKKADIPSELVTASGSGLDPDISPAGARIQVKRIAAARKISEIKINQLIGSQVEESWLGIFGRPKVNVLKLNIALDRLK